MATVRPEPKAHICPPSNANHPSGRWESLFIYSFICKFTTLKGKVEGLDTPMDLEESLMTEEANPVLMQILKAFILNLKPQTRNLGIEQIASTVSAILNDHFRTGERSVFWDESLSQNVDPLHDHKQSFFALGWDMKLKILRQLVEFQLCYKADIKGKIDRAWGVTPGKGRKKESASAQVKTEDVPQDQLLLLPIGQDKDRKRYWVADASPRVYVSTNPWKITALFAAETTTRDEYVALLERLREGIPADGAKQTRQEKALVDLVKVLDDRLPEIEAEMARKERAKKKAEKRFELLAQAELRETRTRRQTKKPAYTYKEEEDDSADEVTGEDYKAADEEEDIPDEDEDFINDAEDSDGRPSKRRRKANNGDDLRRSTRATRNTEKRAASEDDPWADMREGARRSTRLGNTDTVPTTRSSRPSKRARTVESTASGTSSDVPPADSKNTRAAERKAINLKKSGAAALKQGEKAVAAIPGKKKSRFWVYAVDEEDAASEQNGDDEGEQNGASKGEPMDVDENGAEGSVSVSNGNRAASEMESESGEPASSVAEA
ncbi:hypothetical protein CYLTODRAFT_350049 [Cylindrobasidium torrendii FP15055 ss-10]|uniref:WHIM1 domain-containing protein n=1 Tax=Cylindrobasidium torrendii FP15055 ss-10 TaxID=1314674 RepID=A0A0D7BF88_9AGAR|nr:hypothetical protein CYLTODRAFT_350049 [Cylindrobasidium torrendii FP15055 ss-10]